VKLAGDYDAGCRPPGILDTLALPKHVGASSWLVRHVDVCVDEYIGNAPLGLAVSGITVPSTISGSCVTNFRE